MSNSNEVFLLSQVIDELNDVKVSLTSPLFKLRYFGGLIKNEELVAYTKSEIEGYKFGDNIPDYRRCLGSMQLTLQAYVHKHKVDFPVSMLESPYNEKLRYLEINDSIGVIEQFVSDRLKDPQPEPYFYRILPMEMLPLFQEPAERLYRSDTSITVVKAVNRGNAYKMNEVLSSVRHKLLTFTLEIAEKFGYELEVINFKKDLDKNNQAINYYMKTEITGNGNVVNTGDGATITTTVTITGEDKKYLKDLGIDDVKIDELDAIVETNKHDKISLKERVMNWFGEVSAHVAAIGLAHNIPAIAEFVGKIF